MFILKSEIKAVLAALLLAVSMQGCDCAKETDETNTFLDETSLHADDALMSAGGNVEGISVCHEGVCERTGSGGYIGFDAAGSYTFYINGIYLSERNITETARIVSPYTLFDSNATARAYELFVHACDRDEEDTSVSLSFSPYLPDADSFEAFLNDSMQEGNITFSINDHNITIDTLSGFIKRDDINWTYTVIDREVYTALELVEAFFDRAKDKKIALFDSNETFEFERLGPVSFMLGEAYSIELELQSDALILHFTDLESGVESDARFVEIRDENLLQSELVNLEIVE